MEQIKLVAFGLICIRTVSGSNLSLAAVSLPEDSGDILFSKQIKYLAGRTCTHIHKLMEILSRFCLFVTLSLIFTVIVPSQTV